MTRYEIIIGVQMARVSTNKALLDSGKIKNSIVVNKVDQANIPDSSNRYSDPVTGSHIGAMLLMETARQGSRQARKLPSKDVTRQGSRWARGYLRIGIRACW